jgi:hypothetical protein
MGPMSRRHRSPRPAVVADEVPVVGQREPCPCGSGKRYKNCHGRAARSESSRRVARPFEGLPAEADLVAMREIVPSATATYALAQQGEGDARTQSAEVTVCTVLPFGAAALVREDGQILLALQTPTSSGDASRDVAAALVKALAAEPNSSIRLDGLPGDGPRLQDLLALDTEPEVVVHDSFDYWAGSDGEDAMQQYIEQAGSSAIPTRRLRSVQAAYLSTMGDVSYLRWVMATDEETLLQGLARLRTAREDGLGGDTKLLGAFRADGLLVPVWEVPTDVDADDLEQPTVELADRLAAAMRVDVPLTPQERTTRAALVNRQITLTR